MTKTDLALIRTKLAPPKASSAQVKRDALLQQLDQRRHHKVTLILGPAGSGKTTLLAQWRTQLLLAGAKVAWYQAGADDGEAAVAAYIVESLVQAGVTIDTNAVQVYARSGGRALNVLLASLVNGIVDHQGEVYLFIDDFHVLASVRTLQLVDRWIELMPPNFHLVLNSRKRPNVELSRLRADDELTQIDFSELRFSQEETQSYLKAQGLEKLRVEQIRSLHDITDGWVAGLQLLAFSLRKQKIANIAFTDPLSLSQEGSLDEYLEKTTVKQLTDEELDFLVRLSACRRFNRTLAERLTGNPRAAEHLAKFAADNLFVIPIDTADAEPWYRFHRLYSAFLGRRLRRLPEADVARLHQQASRWFADNGYQVEAMRHARLVGDTGWVLELTDRAARHMINNVNFVELLKWCDAIPHDQLRTRLNLCLCAAWAQLSCGRVSDYERNLEDILSHPDHTKPENAIEIQLLHAYHLFRKDDTAAALQVAEGLLHRTAAATQFQSLLMFNIASLCLVYANDFEKARDIARQRIRYEIPEKPGHAKPLIDLVGGFSYLVEGNIRLALPALTAFIDDSMKSVAFRADAVGMYAGHVLEAYYHAGEIRLASALLEDYSDLIEAVGVADGILFARRVRARLQRLRSDHDGARQTLQRLEEFGIRQNLDRLVAWSLYDQIRLALNSGDTALLPELSRRLDFLAELHRDQRACAWSEIGLAALLAKADQTFADRACTSMDAIETADIAARANRRQLFITRLGFMRAVIMLRKGERDAALQTGLAMVRASRDLGLMRVLADVGPQARALIEALQELTLDGPERAYLEQTASELAGHAVAARPETHGMAMHGHSSNPLDDLSPRELEVISLLGKGLSVKGIARVMAISPGTVKWHVKNMYGKLKATSREEALAKARSLHLIH